MNMERIITAEFIQLNNSQLWENKSYIKTSIWETAYKLQWDNVRIRFLMIIFEWENVVPVCLLFQILSENQF